MGLLPAPAADEPKEGDTKSEDGIEYRLQDGRGHRVTPEEKAEEKSAAPAAEVKPVEEKPAESQS